MITNTIKEFYDLLKPNCPIISIDYGTQKLGIAISNRELTMALPLKQVLQTSNNNALNEIIEIIQKYNAAGIVIGVPINMDGTQGPQALNVLKFSRALETKTGVPIFLQDERLTTKAANNMLKSIGFKRKDRNAKDDMLAASLILETVLELKKFN